MSETVFIDVGAHSGGAAAGVLASRFKFDRVISVEPDPEMVEALRTRFAKEIAEGRYAVAPYGLSNMKGAMTLYGSNRGGGASMIAGKVPRDERSGYLVEVIDWPRFLELYDLESADLYVKMNCEGAEVAIVDSIVAHGGEQIKSIVIDFDIVKAPFGGWKKWRSIRALKAAKVPYLLKEAVFVKGAKRPPLENWLGAIEELSQPPIPREPVNWHQVVRVKYLEVVSALGIKHDLLRRPKK